MKSIISSFEELNHEIVTYQKQHGCELYISQTHPISVGNQIDNADFNHALKYFEIIYTCEYGRHLCKNQRSADLPEDTIRQCPFEIVAKATDDFKVFSVTLNEKDHNHSTYKDNFLENAKSIHKSISGIPSIVGGDIAFINWSEPNIVCSLRITQSQKDLENLEKRQLIQHIYLEWDPTVQSLKRCLPMPYPVESSAVVISRPSPDGTHLASIRKVSKGSKDSFILEIFTGNSMIKSINLDKSDKHGIVHNQSMSGDFSDIKWSSSGEDLVYLCERKPDEDQSYFNEKSNKIGTKGTKFNHVSDWGELLTNRRIPTIAKFNMESSAITLFDCVPEDVAVCEICCDCSCDYIHFIGAYVEPYPLGKIYCQNRRCGLFKLNVRDNKCNEIITENVMLYGLRMSPDSTKLIYFSKPSGGPHRSSSNLMLYDIESETESLLYGRVNEHPDDKVGLFSVVIAEKCWAHGCKTIVFDTQVKTRNIIYSIDIESKKLHMLSDEDGDWKLLDQRDDFLLASYQNPNFAGCLKFGKLNEDMTITWNTIDIHENGHSSHIESDFKWEIITSDLGGFAMDSLFYLPNLENSTKKPPLIVCPHGGPHGAFTQMFMSYPVGFCALGYAVLLVNYRGSTGFGDDSLYSLLGKAGTQDVEDMQTVVKQVTDMGLVDDNNKFLFGGSHGGFLSCHLAGDGKSFYRACAMRNPVIDMFSMLQTTDIPDWCCVEAGLPFEFAFLPDVDDFKTFQKCSPIYNADKIDCPVLLLVGDDDARVPPSQSMQLYRYLRSKGKNVMMRTYPNNSHPLNGVEADADVFMTVVKWFANHYV